MANHTPTYIKKEFVGGCDIVKEMFEKGELKKLLEEKNNLIILNNTRLLNSVPLQQEKELPQILEF